MPKPKGLKSPKTEKAGKLRAPQNVQNKPDKSRYPSFSFLHEKRPYRVDDCERADKIALLKAICKLSQIPWFDIYSTSRHQLGGSETIDQSDLKVGLPPNVTKDVTILALRFHDRKPIVGYRDGDVFYIIFIDHNFSVYDHGG